MEDKRIYLLAQFDKATNQKLSNIYDRLAQAGLIGKQTKGIPYHFTLGSFDLGCEAQILERVKKVTTKMKAFDIGLNYIGMFGLNVLFLAPSINIELLNLRNNLVSDELINGYHNWVAHATLLIDNPDNIQTAIPIIAQSFSPFSAMIESIGVIEFSPLKIISEYKLIS